MKEQGNKINQSTIHVMGNNWWVLKFVFRYAPTLIWDKAIRIPIAVAGAYIDINLTRWILDSVEQGTFSDVIKTIITIFSFIIFSNCVQAVLTILVVPQKQVNLCTSMRKELIGKVSRIDQLRFQQSKFFDNYTLALNEVDTRAIQVLETIAAMATSLISFCVITDTTADISHRFSWFGIIAAGIDMTLV